MSWILVGQKEPPPASVPSAALEAAPPELAEGGAAFLPRGPMEGRCRLCGARAKLTKEHLPPASANNKGVLTAYDFDAWLSSDGELDRAEGKHQQGGLFAHTLCASCNNKTGSWYAEEYGRWAERTMQIFAQLSSPLKEIDKRQDVSGVGVLFESVDPGAFVRQCLTIMCSMSGPWDLAGRHSEVKSLILEREVAPLPEPLSLGLGLLAGPLGRTSGPTLHVDLESLQWRWMIELAYPPMVINLVLAGSPLDYPLLDLGQYTASKPGERQDLEFTAPIVFTHTPYPGDYRATGEMVVAEGGA